MKLKTEVFLKKNSRIIFNKELAENRFLLRVEALEIAKLATPGQFVQVKQGDYDPLLPRPFAVSLAENGYIEILYEVKGKGSRLLSFAREGELVSLLGPLGRGFTLPDNQDETLMLIAGGIGLAPLRYLSWVAAKKNFSLVVLYGDKNAVRSLPLEELLPRNLPFYSLVEEGGERTGFVTDFLDEVIVRHRPLHFFVCGPRTMLKEVQIKLTSKGFGNAQFCFEERMSCGYGACQGCAILTRNGFKRVCKEGPVFKGEEIKWEEI